MYTFSETIGYGGPRKTQSIKFRNFIILMSDFCLNWKNFKNKWKMDLLNACIYLYSVEWVHPACDDWSTTSVTVGV